MIPSNKFKIFIKLSNNSIETLPNNKILHYKLQTKHMFRINVKVIEKIILKNYI